MYIKNFYYSKPSSLIHFIKIKSCNLNFGETKSKKITESNIKTHPSY